MKLGPWPKIGLTALLLLLVVLPGIAAAETLTVCPWGCGFGSIQAAIDAAAPGDVVYVYPGFYRESLVITKDITLRGSGPDRVIIQGVRPGWPVISVWTTEPGNLIGIALEEDTPIEVTLDGLQIQGAYWYSSDVECAVYASTICPDGVAVRGRATVTLQNLWIHDNRDNGISLGLRVEATIRNCSIWNNGDDGIHAWLDTEVAILGSTISGNAADGINLQSRYKVFSWLAIGGPVEATVVGNSISGNGRYGIEAQSGDELVTCYGNAIWGNALGPYGPKMEVRCY